MTDRDGSQTPATTSNNGAVPYVIEHEPSAVITSCQKTITIDDKAYELILVSMRRSFLLVVKSLPSSMSLPPVDGNRAKLSPEALVQSFMKSDSPLKGLSLALGPHSTCLIPSENSLASTSLATRLSRKLNLNMPVYVASDVQTPADSLDLSETISKLYLKIFQFVSANYRNLPKDDIDSVTADRSLIQ